MSLKDLKMLGFFPAICNYSHLLIHQEKLQIQKRMQNKWSAVMLEKILE